MVARAGGRGADPVAGRTGSRTPWTPDGRQRDPWLDRRLARRATPTSARALDRLLAERAALTPHRSPRAVAPPCPPAALLVLGSSTPVRDVDLMAAARRAATGAWCSANRGLAGIDGTVSTAIGAALAARTRPGRSR